MASIKDIEKPRHGYYTPSVDYNKEVIEGWYPSHVIHATVNPPRMIKGKYKAKINHLRVEIASVSGYQVKDSNNVMVSTTEYAGRDLYHNGVFFFLSPDEEDSFEENNKDNKLYAELLRAINLPLKKDWLICFQCPHFPFSKRSLHHLP